MATINFTAMNTAMGAAFGIAVTYADRDAVTTAITKARWSDFPGAETEHDAGESITARASVRIDYSELTTPEQFGTITKNSVDWVISSVTPKVNPSTAAILYHELELVRSDSWERARPNFRSRGRR